MKIGIGHTQFVITKDDNIFLLLDRQSIVMFYYLGENDFHTRIFDMKLCEIIYLFGFLEVLPPVNNFMEDLQRTLKLDLVPREVLISFFYILYFFFCSSNQVYSMSFINIFIRKCYVWVYFSLIFLSKIDLDDTQLKDSEFFFFLQKLKS